jgi:hypothetical protein
VESGVDVELSCYALTLSDVLFRSPVVTKNGHAYIEIPIELAQAIIDGLNAFLIVEDAPGSGGNEN